MTHPDIAQAMAEAHRADLLRAATGRTGTVVTRNRRQARRRLVAWLGGQRLGHRRIPTIGTASCAAVSR